MHGVLNPAKPFGQSNAERAGSKSITVEPIPDGDADAGTLEAWMPAVESRSPVSENLRNGTPVEVVLG